MRGADLPCNGRFKPLLAGLFFPTYNTFRKFINCFHALHSRLGIHQIMSEVLITKDRFLIRVIRPQICMRFTSHRYVRKNGFQISLLLPRRKTFELHPVRSQVTNIPHVMPLSRLLKRAMSAQPLLSVLVLRSHCDSPIYC